MTTQEYKELAEKVGPGELGSLVNKLPDGNRAQLFNDLVAEGYNKLVKPLWYNYTTQSFVDGIKSNVWRVISQLESETVEGVL